MSGDVREPTSHERLSGQTWDASYHDGPAPWDVGAPQPAVVRLAAEGAFRGSILDAGCGTGENALHLASTGCRVLGVDVAETALAMAREKAAARGLDAEFVLADARHLDRLDRRFDAVLDCGLFHSFDASERSAYVASLATVLVRAGSLHLLCFADEGPEPGPHPVGRDELLAAFDGDVWEVLAVDPARVRTRFHGDDGASAWLATIRKV